MDIYCHGPVSMLGPWQLFPSGNHKDQGWSPAAKALSPCVIQGMACQPCPQSLCGMFAVVHQP